MNSSRRSFLGGMLPASAVFLTLRALGQTSQSTQPQRPLSPPPSFPKTPQGEVEGVAPDPRAVLKAYQKDIKRDVAKLLELAQELKKEVDKTDSAEVLNLSLLHKAEEIEKLAHDIRTKARS